MDFRGNQFWVQGKALPLTSYVTLGKLFNSLSFSFLNYMHGDNDNSL